MHGQTATQTRVTRRPPFGARVVALAATLIVAASACTGTPDDAAPTTEAAAPTATASPDEPASSPATERATGQEADPAAEVLELWEDAHRRRVIATYDADTEITFDDVADESTASALSTFVEAGRPDVPATLADTQFGTDVEVDVDSADITGCVLTAIAPPDGETFPVLTTAAWEGQARRLLQGWRLTDASLVAGECVPVELSAAAIRTYRDWLAATNDWWDPPNPDDPRIDQLMAAPADAAMREILTEHVEIGIAVRDSHDPSGAVVTEVQDDIVTVSDCYLAIEGDAGAYDLVTEDRREDLTPTPEPDQLDAVVVELRREAAGQFSVVGWSTLIDVQCTPRETPYDVVP